MSKYEDLTKHSRDVAAILKNADERALAAVFQVYQDSSDSSFYFSEDDLTRETSGDEIQNQVRDLFDEIDKSVLSNDDDDFVEFYIFDNFVRAFVFIYFEKVKIFQKNTIGKNFKNDFKKKSQSEKTRAKQELDLKSYIVKKQLEQYAGLSDPETLPGKYKHFKKRDRALTEASFLVREVEAEEEDD